MACETIGWVSLPVRFLRFFRNPKKTWLLHFFSCLTRFLEHWLLQLIHASAKHHHHHQLQQQHKHCLVQGHSVVDSGTSTKRQCNFLLVTNSSLGPILMYFFAYGDIPSTSCSHAGQSLLYIRLCLVVSRKLSLVRLTYWLSVWCYVTICCLYLLIFCVRILWTSHLCVA